MSSIKCVLLDIEGTICPISFVKDTLFPYALKALPDVLASNWDSDDFKPYRDAFPEHSRASPEAFKLHVEDLTKRDVKVAYLKELQGYLWENGYKTGAYATPLFPDVVPQLHRWKDDGIQLAIYSSGSVFAQKLLFGHVASDPESSKKKRKRPDEPVDDEPPIKKQELNGDHSEGLVENSASATLVEGVRGNDATANPDSKDGSKASNGHIVQDEPDTAVTEDLQYMIADWFDTVNAGSKQEPSSYQKIAEALTEPPDGILFLSDNVKEVDAAIAAGMEAVVVDRPGNAPLSDEDKGRLRVVNSLSEGSLTKGTHKGKVDQPRAETQPRRRSQRLKGQEA